MVDFELALQWRRTRPVALWPDPFDALAYHFGNRKLSFLMSRTLSPSSRPSVSYRAPRPQRAPARSTRRKRPAYVRALADLARSQMIEVAA